MVRFLLIIGFLILPVLNNAQTADTNTPVTKTTWFWPLLSVGLVLLLSVPCTLIIVAVFCYMKNPDDSDDSTTDSNSSSSSSVQRRAACLQPQRSHYAGGFRSPPPPYAINERPEVLFLSPSPPPSYTSHLPETNSRCVSPNLARTTVINIEPAESIDNQSANTPEHGRTLDVSSTVTNASLQTFQV